MKKLTNKRNAKGITLIALVVTIVVLLILASVSINLVLGNNGLITKARDAKIKTEQDEINTEAAMNNLTDEIDSILGNVGSENSGVGDDGSAGDETTIDEVKIPVGFYYVGGTKDSGLVISDDSADENKYKDQETVGTDLTGNQFVWIPVDNYDNFHIIQGYAGGEIDDILSMAKEAGASEIEGDPLADNNVAGTTESIEMYKSVKDNGGFYIARYEAGISGTTDNSSLEIQIESDGSVKPLSKFGVGVWNYIPWGGTSSDTASDGLQGDDTANGAVKVARSMYTKSSTCGVTSTLCYGVQWDAIMNFIDSNYVAEACTEDSFVVDSTDKGNYTGTISTTGYYAVKNIYDLAGNVTELTMEALSTSKRFSRGGNYSSTGFYEPASLRNFYMEPNTTRNILGFRVALYL